MGILTRLSVLILFLAHAFAQNTCRDRVLFPHVLCEELSQSECQVAAQHGCVVSDSNSCILDAALASVNRCANNEYPVTDFVLSPSSPARFRLGVNLLDASVNVLLLVDASSSMTGKFPSVVSELSALAENLISHISALVAVAVYAGEQSFATFESHLPLQSMTSNITAVLKTLQSIPSLQLQSGPRTLLKAIDTARSSGTLGFTGLSARRIVIAVGDTPGREPACRTYDFETALRRSNLFSEFVKSSPFTLFAASVGEPGLDSALPAAPECPSRTLCTDLYCDAPAPDAGEAVAAGQASTIASSVNGALLNGVNASALLASVLHVVNGDERFKAGDGSLFRMDDANDNCGDRVVITAPVLPLRIAALSVSTLELTVQLSPRACDSGPFVCTLAIGESRKRESHVHLQTFLVRGCLPGAVA